MTPRFAINSNPNPVHPGGPTVSGVLEAEPNEVWPDRHRQAHWLLARIAFAGQSLWWPWTGALICQDADGDPVVLALVLDGEVIDARRILPPSQRYSIAAHAMDLLELANLPPAGHLNGEEREP